MGHSRPLFLYFRLFNTQLTVYKCSILINICRWLDSNCGTLVLEATALPTEPQPLPNLSNIVNFQIISMVMVWIPPLMWIVIKNLVLLCRLKCFWAPLLIFFMKNKCSVTWLICSSLFWVFFNCDLNLKIVLKRLTAKNALIVNIN